MHGGSLSGLPPVKDCLHDPKLVKMWGVEKPAIVSVSGKEYEVPLIKVNWGGEQIEIYRHPMFFVSEDIRAWMSSYKMSDHIAKKDYLDCNYLWFDAVEIYETALKKYKKKD